MTSILKDIAKVWVNEYKLVFSDVGAMIFIIFLPLAYPILYSLIYNREVVKEVPIVVVDECRTPMSREYARMLDATEQVRVADYAVNMQDARRRMAEREAYGIVYLPSDFSRNVGRGEQARMEAYCDMSVILRYKNRVTAITTVNSELGGKVQMGKVNQLENPPSGGVMPISFRMVPVGNNSMGMGSAIAYRGICYTHRQGIVLCYTYGVANDIFVAICAHYVCFPAAWQCVACDIAVGSIYACSSIFRVDTTNPCTQARSGVPGARGDIGVLLVPVGHIVATICHERILEFCGRLDTVNMVRSSHLGH